MRLRKHLWFQEKTKNWKSNIESSPMDAELSIPCKVPNALTGYDGQGAGEAVGEALRELSRVTEYDDQLESLSQDLKRSGRTSQ